jgi:hypothetical protein
LLGYFGSDAIVTMLHQDGLHWEHLKQDAIKLVRNCPECRQHNTVKTGYHPLRNVSAYGPGEHYAFDFGTFNITSALGTVITLSW